MSNLTEKFHDIWLSIIVLHEAVFQETLSKEESFLIQEEKLSEAQKLIEEGADINEPFYNERESNTPLGNVLSAYYYTDTKYMNNDFLDNMIYFLFSNDVVTDKNSITTCVSCIRDMKLLEELLKRANDDDIKLNYNNNNILYLETIIGFSNVKLDDFIQYEFSYVNKEENVIYFKNYYYLPIEVTLLDYATEKGSAIITKQERQEIIRLFKKKGSPNPSIERINTMFLLMEEKETWASNMNDIRERFKEAYDFYINI